MAKRSFLFLFTNSGTAPEYTSVCVWVCVFQLNVTVNPLITLRRLTDPHCLVLVTLDPGHSLLTVTVTLLGNSHTFKPSTD